jgi:hypothetical protein
MKGAAVAGLLAISILVGAGAGYLLGNAGERVITTTSTAITTTTAITNWTLDVTLTSTTTVGIATTTEWSTTSKASLELIAGVSPSVVKSGQNVTVNWGVYNPLSTAVEVNVPIYENRYLSPCPLYIVPTTFDIYSGHLSSSNLTSATPLLLYNASIAIPCFAGADSTLTFQPHSDRATVNTLNSTMMASMNYTTNYRGYWTGGFSTGSSFNAFPPGMYTVMFNDTWGQQELRYFAVHS